MRRKNAAGRSAWLVPRSVAADSSSDCCWRLLGGSSQSCQFQAVAAPSRWSSTDGSDRTRMVYTSLDHRYCTSSCSTGSLCVGRCWLRAAGGVVVHPWPCRFLLHAPGLSFCSLFPSFLCPLFLDVLYLPCFPLFAGSLCLVLPIILQFRLF